MLSASLLLLFMFEHKICMCLLLLSVMHDIKSKKTGLKQNQKDKLKLGNRSLATQFILPYKDRFISTFISTFIFPKGEST